MSFKVNDKVRINLPEMFKNMLKLFDNSDDNMLSMISKDLARCDGQIGKIIDEDFDDCVQVRLLSDNSIHCLKTEFLTKIDDASYRKDNIELGDVVKLANEQTYLVVAFEDDFAFMPFKGGQSIPLKDYTTNLKYKKKTMREYDVVEIKKPEFLFTNAKPSNSLLDDGDRDLIKEMMDEIKMNIDSIINVTKKKDVPRFDGEKSNALIIKIDIGKIVAYFDGDAFDNLEYDVTYTKDELGL